MYIFRGFKLIYIRVPKTGSTSFIHSMTCAGHKPKFMGHKKGAYSEHFTAAQAEQFIDPVVWATYRKIAFVRHPYDWVRSLYKAKLTTMYLGEDRLKPFPEFLRRLKPTTNMFRWYKEPYGDMLIDDIYRTEDMGKFLPKLFNAQEEHKNRTPNNDIVLTDDDKRIIDILFAREMEYYKEKANSTST